jgi:hypothetical protein
MKPCVRDVYANVLHLVFVPNELRGITTYKNTFERTRVRDGVTLCTRRVRLCVAPTPSIPRQGQHPAKGPSLSLCTSLVTDK